MAYIIREKKTNKVIIEIFNRKLIPMLKDRYYATDTLTYLQQLNRKTKEGV